jgi:hypothetical protein
VDHDHESSIAFQVRIPSSASVRLRAIWLILSPFAVLAIPAIINLEGSGELLQRGKASGLMSSPSIAAINPREARDVAGSSPGPAYDPTRSSRLRGSARFVPELRRVWCSMSPRMTVRRYSASTSPGRRFPRDAGQTVGKKSLTCTLRGRRVR